MVQEGRLSGPGRSQIIYRPDGPIFPVDGKIGIVFLEKNMPLGLSPLVFLYTITAELVLVLNLSEASGSRSFSGCLGNSDVITLSVHLSVTSVGVWRAARISQQALSCTQEAQGPETPSGGRKQVQSLSYQSLESPHS